MEAWTRSRLKVTVNYGYLKYLNQHRHKLAINGDGSDLNKKNRPC